ncbi:MAG: hypothetical protein IPL75_11720 [Acidobacteria bacterium]|nr:hypothetical protein [Acidobacteriota bacterium]
MIDLIGLLAGAFTSLFTVALRELFTWYRARQKLQSAEEAQFLRVLSSDSLTDLGDYLDNAVGQFSVAEYGQNDKVRRRVNMFLACVEEFVGKADGVRIAVDPAPPPVNLFPRDASPDADLLAIEYKVLDGAVWDGLAHLRRVIEQRLRHLAMQRNLAVPERPGASRLIELLRRHEVGTDEAWKSLRYVIDVCNRAVHGLEVSTSEALEVIRYSRGAFNALNLSSPGGSRGIGAS